MLAEREDGSYKERGALWSNGVSEVLGPNLTGLLRGSVQAGTNIFEQATSRLIMLILLLDSFFCKPKMGVICGILFYPHLQLIW